MSSIVKGTSTSQTVGVADLHSGSYIEFRDTVVDAEVTPSKALRTLENAVYSYIRAMRSLGHDTVNTSDIAKGLGVSLSDVEVAVAGLRRKGVKPAKR